MFSRSKSSKSLLGLVAPNAPQLQTYAEPYDGQAPSAFLKDRAGTATQPPSAQDQKPLMPLSEYKG